MSATRETSLAAWLKYVIDDLQIHTRAEWASILGTREDVVELWIDDKLFITCEALYGILFLLKERYIVEASTALAAWSTLSKTSPDPWFGRSLADYVVKPMYNKFRMALGVLDPDTQREFLKDAISRIRKEDKARENNAATFAKSSLGQRFAREGLPVEPLRPSSLYFHVGYAWRHYDENYHPLKDEVVVTICPCAYFDKYGYVIDTHLGISHLLPPRVAEAAEALFTTEGWTVDDLRKELLTRGFVQGEAYSKFAEAHDPFV